MVAVSASTGCLVLDEVTFPDEEPAPSRIRDAPNTETRIGSVIKVPASSTMAIPFNVLIHDENVWESLAARLVQITPDSRILADDFGCNADGGEARTVPATGVEERNFPFGFSLPPIEGATCYQLMLVIANSYVFPCNRLDDLLPDGFNTAVTETDPPDQAGVARWWIVTTENADSPADMSDCQDLFTELQEADAP